MPKKRNNGRKKRGRRGGKAGYKSAAGRYTTRQSVRRTALDPHMYITLRYASYISNTVTSGSATVQTFNLNSCFDPDRTGSGTQPYGWNQYEALYNRYRVLRTKWRITFLSTTGSYLVFVIPANGLIAVAPTTAQTFSDIAMNPRARTKAIGLNAPPAVLSGSVGLAELNGVTRTEYLADDRFEAAVGSSPTEIMTLSIGLFNQTAGSLGLNLFAEIWYEVDLHDPILLPASA